MESSDNRNNRTKPSIEAVRILRDYIRQGDEEPSSKALPDLGEVSGENTSPTSLSESEKAILDERERLAGIRRSEAIAAARAQVLDAKQKIEARNATEAAAAAAKEARRIERASRPIPRVATPDNPGNSEVMQFLSKLLGKD